MKILNDLNEKGIATGHQYIVVNGERYYFDREFVSDYGLKDAEIDAFRVEIAQKSNIELSHQKHKTDNSGYRSIGIMPNGNYIVYNSKRKYGVFDSNGNIVVPFIYEKIEPIMKNNGETVHDNFYIAKRKVRKMVDPKDGSEFYLGDSKAVIVSSKGEESFPVCQSKMGQICYFDKIIYDEQNDLLNCVSNDYYKGVYARGGYAGYENPLTINASELEQYFTQHHIDRNPTFITRFNAFLNKYVNETFFWNDHTRIDTNVVSQLLDEINYLMDELTKMEGKFARDELISFAMHLKKIENNLQNYIKHSNFSNSQRKERIIGEPTLEENISEEGKDVMPLDGPPIEQEYGRQSNIDEVHQTIEPQQELHNQESVETNSVFIDQFNMFIKKYNEYLAMCYGDTMNVDINFVSQLLDTANYLMDELIKMKDSVIRDELVRYGMQLEQYANNLQNHINLVNQASSIFRR